MIPTSMATERLAKSLKYWTFGVAGFFAIACLFVSGSAVASMVSASSAKGQIPALKEAVKSMNEKVERSKRLTVRIPGKRNSDRIQAVVDDAALLNRCRLLEFQANSDVQPYFSKYLSDTKVKGWVQTTAQFQLDGSFTGAFEVIRTLCSAPDPVEVDSIEINSGRTKTSEVNVKVTFRILAMEATK